MKSGERVSLGLDIGGTSIKGVLQVGGEVVQTLVSDSHRRPDLEKLARNLGVLAEELLQMEAIDAEDVDAVGLSVAGPIEHGVLRAAANVPALFGVHLSEWAARALGMDADVRVMTDTLAAALCEHGLQPVAERALYLAIGAGVGGAVLDDGKPLLFTRGTCGHLGHIDVSGGEDDAPRQPGAGRGSLEAYMGSRALRRADVPLSDPDWSLHATARPALAALARGVRIMLVIYRPACIVFLGGVGLQLTRALDQIRFDVEQELSPAAPEAWELRCGVSDRFAAARGAAAAVHCVS